MADQVLVVDPDGNDLVADSHIALHRLILVHVTDGVVLSVGVIVIIEPVVLHDGVAGLVGIGADHFVQERDGAESVVALAVAVIVDELAPPAVEGLFPVAVKDLGVDVVLEELLVGNGVGQIALLIAGGGSGLGADVYIAGDLVLNNAVVHSIVSSAKDAADHVQIIIADVVVGADDLVVSHGIGVAGPGNGPVIPWNIIAVVTSSNRSNVVADVAIEGVLGIGGLEGYQELQTLIAGVVAHAVEVDIVLNVSGGGHLSGSVELGGSVDLAGVTELSDLILAGIGQGQDFADVLGIDQAALANVSHLGGDVQSAGSGLVGDLQSGLALGQDLAAV